MLSILIPVYNQSVVTLVKALRAQCEDKEWEYQILVYDDKSTDEIRKVNEEVAFEFNVSYVELSDNLGRAKIRNRLAKMARYKYLLFLDGDSTVIKDDFIEPYLEAIQTAYVVYGGRTYQKEKPETEFVLHWKYGKEREALPTKARRHHPYLSFQTNNFMIQSHVLKEVMFDEEVEGYGYEDLLFAEKLKDLGYGILHIDNPIQHDGLESAELFVKKNLDAVANLVRLNMEGQLTDVRLTKTYNKIKSLRLLGTVKTILQKMKPRMDSNLTSDQPSVRYFNLIKLAEYDRLVSKERI